MPRFVAGNRCVLCDESGHKKFPFLCLAHVTLLTPAQVRLRICSGLFTFAHPNYTGTIFGRLR